MFESLNQLTEQMILDHMNAPLCNLHTAFNNPGFIYDTWQSHNGKRVMIGYEKNIGQNVYVSGACKMRLASGEEVYCIFVDANFMLLNKEEQLVMFYHEMGHIINDHLDKSCKLVLSSLARYFGYGCMEFEADKYAAKKTSTDRVVDTLTHVAAMIPFISKRDVESRVKKLVKTKLK